MKLQNIQYTEHRVELGALKEYENKYSILTGKLPKEEYVRELI